MPAPAAVLAIPLKKKLISLGISLVFFLMMCGFALMIAIDTAKANLCDPASVSAAMSASALPVEQAAHQPGDPDPTELEKFMAAKRQLESGGNYQARYSGPGSDASGAYQYISSTWNSRDHRAIWSKYGNFPQAYLAPPAVQDEVARSDFMSYWHTYRNWFQVAMMHYYPAWVNDPSKWDSVPRPDAGNRLTLREYAEKVLKVMEQPNDAPLGTDAASTACRGQINGSDYVGDGTAGSLAVASASKYIGVGYTWGGGHNAGTQWNGMDCSSFTFNAYRDLGVTIGMTTYTQINNGVSLGTNLASARPGDLILVDGHVLMYHSLQNGKHMVLESWGGISCSGPNPTFGANPNCRGIGPAHPFADSRAIVDIRRIVCSVNAGGQAVACGAGPAA